MLRRIIIVYLSFNKLSSIFAIFNYTVAYDVTIKQSKRSIFR